VIGALGSSPRNIAWIRSIHLAMDAL
jgi:hypothetical protein